MSVRFLPRAVLLTLAGLAVASLAPAAPSPKPARPAPAAARPAPAVTAPAAPAPAATPPPAPMAPLRRAQEFYDSTHFAEAVTLLGAALEDGSIGGDDVNVARGLRARCLVKAGRRIEGKEAFKSLLRADAAWRPDASMVPPDEMEVFQLALKEFQAEQVEAGKRYPSSIGGWYGGGQAVNQDIADLASSAGAAPADDFKASAEFGYSVRFPVKPRWSVDVEVSRLRATTEDKLPPGRNAHATYTVSGLPIVVSLLRHFGSSPKLHLSGFVGAGIMPSEAIVEYHQSLVSGRIIPTQILGRSTGRYLHVGAEAEYHLQPRLAVSGRVLARYASSGDLSWPRDDFELYETYPASVLGRRSVDFSGISASLGVRAYIGY
jgi:hypothetical protein